MNHIDEYDDLTAAEIIDHLSENSFSTEELRAIKTYEHENKDRITVRRTIDDMLVSDTDVGDEVDNDDEGEGDDGAARTVELDTESMSTNETTADDGAERDGEENRTDDLSPQVDDTEGPNEDPETVRVRLGRSGYAAGHSFEDAREVQEVDYNRRVQLAIERGTLTRV